MGPLEGHTIDSPEHVTMAPETQAKLRAQIAQAFGRRFEGTACIYDLLNEIEFDRDMTSARRRDLLRCLLEQLVTEGRLKVVANPPGSSDHPDYRIYELA